MTKFFLRSALLAGASLLVACGGKSANESESVAADTSEETQDVATLEIPDAPPNPLIELNAKKSAEYLAENGAKDGVRTLESGLQIETVTAGEGAKPTEADLVRFHFVGKTIDGAVLQDSRQADRPFVVPSPVVPEMASFADLPIPGLPEGMLEIQEGETAIITVPPALGFGEEGIPGAIQPNQTLVYEVELLEVVGAEATDRRAEIEAAELNVIKQAQLAAIVDETEAQLAQIDNIVTTLPKPALETEAFKTAKGAVDAKIVSFRTAGTALVEGAKVAELSTVDTDGLVDTRTAAFSELNQALQTYVAEVGNANAEASDLFLKSTRIQEGVVTTESGLQYLVMEDGGKGDTPNPWDTVTVNYKGTLPDGTQFDSSYDRGEPASFPLNGVIKGWTEGVGLMNVGDKYKFYIPSDLAYGANPRPGGLIGPNQALVFEVELLEIAAGAAPTETPATPHDHTHEHHDGDH